MLHEKKVPKPQSQLSIPAAGELDSVARNTPTALGSLQLKTLPTTKRDKHAHHQATSPRLALEERRDQFGGPGNVDWLQISVLQNSLISIHNAESSGKASTEATDGFPHFEGRMPWGSSIQDEEISASRSFASVSSTLPLPATWLALVQNALRQPPQSLLGQPSQPSSAFGQLTQPISALSTLGVKLCPFEARNVSNFDLYTPPNQTD
ncbi:hypothetical protein Trihar35433_1984 [Trichoderma harzianum]|nr:hypothetical protein Trihar35433_1984 [Trichoderma harzianum]